MDQALFDKLSGIAKEAYAGNDAAHDWAHIMRVFDTAEQLRQSGKYDVDTEVLWPAILFHDLVKYDVRAKKALYSAWESARMAVYILRDIKEYPARKIPHVYQTILEHSFSVGLHAERIESVLLQDADKLDAIGFPGIKRALLLTKQMKCTLYDDEDPFCESRPYDPKNNTIDFLRQRHEMTIGKLNTDEARKMAQPRLEFFYHYLQQFSDRIGVPLPYRNAYTQKPRRTA